MPSDRPDSAPAAGRRATLSTRALLLVCLAAPLAAHAQELPAGFGWFRQVVGHCWSGLLPDGSTRHTHCYTAQFGTFIRGTSTLTRNGEGERSPLFEGDSMFAWDATKARIVYYLWASDGSHRQLEAQVLGEELAFPVPSRADPTKVAYRSVWRLADAESIEVRRERPDGDTWRTEFRVLYRRSPAR